MAPPKAGSPQPIILSTFSMTDVDVMYKSFLHNGP